jgi:dienelactone hydrolase
VSVQSPNLINPFDLSEKGEQLTISGELRVPITSDFHDPIGTDPEKILAVVVLHGSAGLDSRGALYIEALNGAGIATLEIDMWAARGFTEFGDRPALPTLTVPDALSALKYLAAHPNIDPERIGVIGFSWGGVIAMLSATEPFAAEYGDGLGFAAHVAHYPVCWAYNVGLPFINFNDLTGAPVTIQIGDRDDYDNGEGPCESLAASFPNVSVSVYQNAYHAWDRLQPALTVEDPFSNQGLGGEVEIIPNPGKAFQSRANAVHLFIEAFGMH